MTSAVLFLHAYSLFLYFLSCGLCTCWPELTCCVGCDIQYHGIVASVARAWLIVGRQDVGEKLHVALLLRVGTGGHLPTPSSWLEVLLSSWRGGATGKAFGLAISRSRVQILLEATLRNNLGQVVYTYVPLSSSSITWYRPKGGDALRLGRYCRPGGK